MEDICAGETGTECPNPTPGVLLELELQRELFNPVQTPRWKDPSRPHGDVRTDPLAAGVRWRLRSRRGQGHPAISTWFSLDSCLTLPCENFAHRFCVFDLFF